jgi:acyl dehydratase
MFTLALLIGLSVYETTHGTTVANLGFEEIEFPTPVFHGDSIRAQTEVVSARESSSRPTQGIVVFEHRAFNQKDELVAQCRRSALMHKRPA